MLKQLKLIMVGIIMVFGFNINAFAEDVVDIEEDIESVQEETLPEDQVIDYQEEPEQFYQENVIQEEIEPTKYDEQIAEQISVDALNDYQVEGSLFEKITLLEQDKVVLQLEKERAQLDLELERLNAEKLKLQMELDTLSGRAENQQQELEVAKAKLEAQAEQLRRQKDSFDTPEVPVVKSAAPKSRQPEEFSSLGDKYKLVNIVGMGNQLQATLQETQSGQNKRVSVGKELDGFTVKSISLNDGIVFEKDGILENLNIGK